ncbi:MAG TPA: hypothetical protein VJ714_09590, partial [Anaerolineae bacterium]|nr:hypothetical protein [Anaerolineae bacterium]
MKNRTRRDRLESRGAAITLTAAIIVTYLLLVYRTYQTFTSQVPGGNDFYPRWRGARALIVEGRDPYSADVTLQI